MLRTPDTSNYFKGNRQRIFLLSLALKPKFSQRTVSPDMKCLEVTLVKSL
jgi:hypothetical protein